MVIIYQGNLFNLLVEINKYYVVDKNNIKFLNIINVYSCNKVTVLDLNTINTDCLLFSELK